MSRIMKMVHSIYNLRIDERELAGIYSDYYGINHFILYVPFSVYKNRLFIIKSKLSFINYAERK